MKICHQGTTWDVLDAGRLCDQPPAVKAALMVADPDGYFPRVRVERVAEAEAAVADALAGWSYRRSAASATWTAELFRWVP